MSQSPKKQVVVKSRLSALDIDNEPYKNSFMGQDNDSVQERQYYDYFLKSSNTQKKLQKIQDLAKLPIGEQKTVFESGKGSQHQTSVFSIQNSNLASIN